MTRLLSTFHQEENRIGSPVPGAKGHDEIRVPIAVKVHLATNTFVAAGHGVTPAATIVLIAPGAFGGTGQEADGVETLTLAIPHREHAVYVCAQGETGDIFNPVIRAFMVSVIDDTVRRTVDAAAQPPSKPAETSILTRPDALNERFQRFYAPKEQ